MFLRGSQQRGVLRNWMKRTGLHQVNLQLQIIDSNNKHQELNLTLGLDSLCSWAFQLTLSISPTTLPCAQAAALLFGSYLKFLLVQFSCSVMFDSLQPQRLQHVRLLCPSPTPRACSNSCPLSQWCHPTISSSVIPFSSCLQSFPASVFSNESVLCIRWL